LPEKEYDRLNASIEMEDGEYIDEDIKELEYPKD